MILLRVLTAVLPVFAFLGGLVFIDSFKLVRFRSVAVSVAAGTVAAAAAFVVQTWLVRSTGLGFTTLTRYVAPIVEELLKSVFIILLLRTNRIGFLVDAAIHGFAVGAGFAVLENIYYLQGHTEIGLAAWVVRGFGTAVMHGGSTAIFAVVARTMFDRGSWRGVAAAWLPAVAIHSAFNHIVLPPIAMALLLVAALPPIFAAIFNRSERATSHWLGSGFDVDQEVIRVLLSEAASESRIARYLAALRDRFAGEVVADMLCYIRLHAELSIRAKGILMLRQTGFEIKPDPGVAARLEEMEYLRKSIGVTGLLAIAPFIQKTGRERWQMNLLKEVAGKA